MVDDTLSVAQGATGRIEDDKAATGASGAASPGTTSTALVVRDAGERKPPESGHSVPQGTLPALFVVLLLVFATTSQGAFAVSRWAPLALLCLAVIIGAVVGRGARPRHSVAALAVLTGMWGLVILAAVSTLWAHSAADAWHAADRQTLYAAIATLPFVLPLHRRSLAAIGWAVSAGIGVIALWTLIRLLSNGPAQFLAGRLNAPVDYRNATALLFVLPVWPFIVACATRELSRFVRAAALALAVLCLGLAFLTQSRGILLGFAAGGVVCLSFGPDRIRRVWVAVLAIAGIGLASPWLLKPFHAFAGGAGTVGAGTIATAAHALLVLTLAGFVVGMALALFDRGLRADGPGMENARGIARFLLVAAATVGVIGALAAVGNPVTYAHNKWDQFRSLNDTTPTTIRLTSTGGQRYDLWRVALKEFSAHPVLGVGADNYQYDYYRLRATNRNLTDPHSLLFSLLAEDGLVGTGLFVVFLGGIAWALRRGWRRLDPDARRSAIAPAAAGAVLVGQSLVDWMWLIPGLTAIGILLLAVAAAQADAEPAHEVARDGAGSKLPSFGRPLRVLGAGGVALAALSVLALYLSDAYVQRARSEVTNPAAQLSAARTAGKLDPFSVTPRYLEASALEGLGNRPAALAQLENALSLEPSSFATLGVLGDFEVRGGHYAAARHFYREALALNPLDTGLQQLSRIAPPRRG